MISIYLKQQFRKNNIDKRGWNDDNFSELPGNVSKFN